SPAAASDDLVRVLHATSAVTRTPVAWLPRRGPARSLFLRAAAALCPNATRGQVADLVDVDRKTAIRASKQRDPAVRAVAHALADLRFQRLADGDLRRIPGWSK